MHTRVDCAMVFYDVIHVDDEAYSCHYCRRHSRSSSVNFGGRHFCPKIYVWKIYKMPEFYVIFARKIIKMPEFLLYLPEKLKSLIYMIISRKIFSSFFFFGGGRRGQVPSPAPRLLVYAYGRRYRGSVIITLFKCLGYSRKNDKIYARDKSANLCTEQSKTFNSINDRRSRNNITRS